MPLEDNFCCTGYQLVPVQFPHSCSLYEIILLLMAPAFLGAGYIEGIYSKNQSLGVWTTYKGQSNHEDCRNNDYSDAAKTFRAMVEKMIFCWSIVLFFFFFLWPEGQNLELIKLTKSR